MFLGKKQSSSFDTSFRFEGSKSRGGYSKSSWHSDSANANTTPLGGRGHDSGMRSEGGGFGRDSNSSPRRGSSTGRGFTSFRGRGRGRGSNNADGNNYTYGDNNSNTSSGRGRGSSSGYSQGIGQNRDTSSFRGRGRGRGGSNTGGDYSYGDGNNTTGLGSDSRYSQGTGQDRDRSSFRGRGRGRGGSNAGRGGSNYSFGDSNSNTGMGSNSGYSQGMGQNRDNSRGGRGFMSNSGNWGGNAGMGGGSSSMSLFNNSKELDSAGDWHDSSGGNNSNMGMSSGGDWNSKGNSSYSSNYNPGSSAGGSWQTGSNQGFMSQSSMASGSWKSSSSQSYSNSAFKGQDSRPSNEWESRSDRGRSFSRGWDSSRSRGGDGYNDRSKEASGGWKLGQSSDYSNRNSGYGNEGFGMNSSRGQATGSSYMGADRNSSMGFNQESRVDLDITEKAMDILNVVLGPQGNENTGYDYPTNKRRRMDYESDQADYQSGPHAHGNVGRDGGHWGPSSHGERLNNESNSSRWGPPNKRQSREQDGGSGGRWGSQSQVSTQFGEDNRHNKQGYWGSQSQSQNDSSQYRERGGTWHGGASSNEGQWGSQGKVQQSSRFGSQSQRDYHSSNQEQRWNQSQAANRHQFADQEFDGGKAHQTWRGEPSHSRGNHPSVNRRRPLLGPCPNEEKPNPKPLLGSFPDPDQIKPKGKPLLGPYPGFAKMKSNPLLGEHPSHGSFNEGMQEEENYDWEMPPPGQRPMRGRGIRGRSRASRVVGRGRPFRGRGRAMSSQWSRGSMGYEGEEFYDNFEHYEEGGGEQFWPPSYEDSQLWQFEDLSWQQFGGRLGGFQPQRLSVTERLGDKKPTLLGTAPSLDLVKQLLTPDERKRLSKKYGSVPLASLHCHMCNESGFASIDSYLMHQIGKRHVIMTRAFYSKCTASYDLLKADVKLALRRDRTVTNAAMIGYCYMCDVPKFGNAHHRSVDANRLLHRYVKPICCNHQRFSNRLVFESHRLSLKHLENEYKKMQDTEEKLKKRLTDLKEELKDEELKEDVEQIEEEEKKFEEIESIEERIKAMILTVLVPKKNALAREKLPDKIVKLKTAREINVRMKKPVKTPIQSVPYDPSEPVGLGNMIISTHFRCSICSKSIDPNKESVIEHCSSLDHYNNAVRKKEELENTAATEDKEEEKKEVGKEEMEEEPTDGQGAVAETGEDSDFDDPMEDPYEGASGDISTLMNEMEEMMENEGDRNSEDDEQADVPEGFVDTDELIYDEGDIAEEFRDVLDYNPNDVDEENVEDAEEKKEEEEEAPKPRRGRAATRAVKAPVKSPVPTKKVSLRKK